jgi:hypothetical protein
MPFGQSSVAGEARWAANKTEVLRVYYPTICCRGPNTTGLGTNRISLEDGRPSLVSGERGSSVQKVSGDLQHCREAIRVHPNGIDEAQLPGRSGLRRRVGATQSASSLTRRRILRTMK